MKFFWTMMLLFAGAVEVSAVSDHEPPSPPPAPTETKSCQDADMYFGPLTYASWSGTLPANNNLLIFELHWIEAGYSAYDIDQSSGKFAHQSELVAVLTLPDRNVRLFGKRHAADQILFVDADLLIDSDHSKDDWSSFVGRMKAVNGSGGFDLQDQQKLVLNSDGGPEIEVFLSSRHGKGLNRQPDKAITMTDLSGRPTSSHRQVWVGAFTGQDESTVDGRMAMLWLGDQPTNKSAVAMATWRPRLRRLVGAIPKSSHWYGKGKNAMCDKAAFVHTLQKLREANLYWYENKFDERIAGPILEQAIGKRLTKTEFLQDVENTFGSVEKAVACCCPFPEVRHMPLSLRATLDGDRLIGTAWVEGAEEHSQRMNAMVDWVTLPATGPAQCKITLINSFVAPGVDSATPEYDVTLRVLTGDDANQKEFTIR